MRRALVPLALAALSLAPPAEALDDPAPANDRWVEAFLRVEQPDLVTLEVQGVVTLRKFVIAGTPYSSADDIANAYQQHLQADAFALEKGLPGGRAPSFLASMAGEASRGLAQTLERSFPGAIVNVTPGAIDETTLAPPTGDPHEPGVLLFVRARVERTPADLGLGNLTLDAADAALEHGAIVSSQMTLAAEAGYDVTYRIEPPALPRGLAFDGIGPAGVADELGGAIVATLRNAAGVAPLARDVAFRLLHPDAVAAAPEDEAIDLSALLTLERFDAGSTSFPVTVDAEAKIRAVDVPRRFGAGALPASVSLRFASGDALRRLHAAGAIQADAVRSAEESLRGSVRESLRNVLGETQPTADADLAADPPRLRFRASGPYEGPEGAENLDLALRIGANVTLDVPQITSDLGPVVVELAFPPPAEVVAASEDGRRITFRHTTAPIHTPDETSKGSSLDVVVDLHTLDVTMRGALGGDYGTLAGDVRATLQLGVLDLPAEIGLPASVDLPRLSSDALRLLHERGLLTREDVDRIEQAFLANVSLRLGEAMGAPVEARGGIVNATLDPSRVGDNVSGDDAIVLEARATIRKRLDGAPEPAAALALYRQAQAFTFPRVQGLATTYTIVLPRGLAIEDAGAEGGEAQAGRAADGRHQLVVRPGSDAAVATMTLAVTPTLVLVELWPAILLAILLLVLLVGTPLAILRRRRAKRRKRQ